MTKKFSLDKKELLEHKELIVMLKLVEQFEDNSTQPIRYSKLRENCNNKLLELTDGRYDFGGSFETYIKNLHRDGIIVREKASPKRTFIIPDIPKIMSHLEKKEMVDSLNTMNLVEKQFDLELLSKLVRDTYFETYLHRPMNISNHRPTRHRPSAENLRYINYIWKVFGVEVFSYPSPYKLTYAYPHGNTFYLDEKAVKNLLKIGNHIGRTNANYPTYSVTPFKIILEFRGKPHDLSFEKICECFLRWVNEFHNILISKEDKDDLILFLTNKKDSTNNPEIESLFYQFWNDMIDAQNYQMDKL